MSKKRAQYSTDFKVKIALAAIRGDETVPQLAARHGVHPTQINTWKRHLIEHAASAAKSCGFIGVSSENDCAYRGRD